jgi:DNA repair protein RadA/Sms
MRIQDVGVELPLAVALYSARSDKPLPRTTSIAGEVTLAGEVRPVPQMARRARTGKEIGFERCIGPGRLRDGEASEPVRWTAVATISEAITALYG